MLSGTREVSLTCLHAGWRRGVESEAGVALAGWVDWLVGGLAFDPGGTEQRRGRCLVGRDVW